MLRGVDALAALVGRRALLSTLSGAAPKAAAKKQRKRLRARQEARAQAESDPKPDAIAANPLRFESVVHEETRHVQVARLAHGLDRVLFNPGIHWLKDPRTDTFNFDPFLETVTKPEDFNFDALPPYKIASADEILNSMAHKHKTKYFSSTSSITNLLAQFYHFFSQQRGINNSGFTMEFADQPTKYTSYQRKPTSALLKYKDGVYSIDQEKPDNAETAKGNEILMTLGKSLEKLLTAEKPEYATYLKSANLPPDHTFPQDEAFHYAILEGFLLRSQLDCIHPALPGKTFDIKTRASVIVRMDPERFAEHDDYRLTKLKGLMSSFEREYHDMARSAMLKYNLQVRIGRMDGIFVAYHNTHTMFGFQYISREEMNSVLFGSCALGDAAFALCVKGLEKVLDAVVARYGAQDVRVTLQVQKNKPEMVFYAEGAEGEEGKGPLTKWRFRILNNSYDLLKMQADKFRPEQWEVLYDLKELAHEEAPLPEASTSVKEQHQKVVDPFSVAEEMAGDLGDVFSGESGTVRVADKNPKQPKVVKNLYTEYSSVRMITPNLDREHEGGRRDNTAFVKQLKKAAANTMIDFRQKEN